MNDVISIIAVLVAPVVAVWITQHLQDRSVKRKDKMEIFKILMMNRCGWTWESVRALNIIEIVFADDDSVRKMWKDYYDRLCVENPNETERKKIIAAENRLIEAMANSLGYKNIVTWETIQNPYIPKGMVEAMEQQKQITHGQLEWAKSLREVLTIFSVSPKSGQEDVTKEEK